MFICACPKLTTLSLAMSRLVLMVLSSFSQSSQDKCSHEFDDGLSLTARLLFHVLLLQRFREFIFRYTHVLEESVFSLEYFIFVPSISKSSIYQQVMTAFTAKISNGYKDFAAFDILLSENKYSVKILKWTISRQRRITEHNTINCESVIIFNLLLLHCGLPREDNMSSQKLR